MRIPVGEAPNGVILPSPHMQLVERRQSEAVRGVDQIQKVPFQLRRTPVRVPLGPGRGYHDELDPNETKRSTLQGLID